MNELVRLNTSDVSKAIPITDSLVISEKTNREHRVILKLIRDYKEHIKEFGQVAPEMQLVNFKTRSQEIEIYPLNEGQATFLITLMRNTPEVLKFKKDLVKAFMFCKNELQARAETRAITKIKRKELTESIKNCVTDEGNFKKFAYSNYSKLVYKKVLGKTVKKAKEELGLKEKDNIRNYLTVQQLEKVQELESKIATYIEFTDNAGKTDKEIYQDVKKYIETSKEVI